MLHCSQGRLLLLAALLALCGYSQAFQKHGEKIKSATFLSPKLMMVPGSVQNRDFYNIDFPRGHVFLKSFDAEVVDEAGKPVPLYETYLHHYLVDRYYQRQESTSNTQKNDKQGFDQKDVIFVRNSGICQGDIFRQYFAGGSETRKTATYVQDPYGIEIGDPNEIPEGYEERWKLNVHVIDIRGVDDRMGCIECRCDLYNTTVDELGNPLPPAYKGGLSCCYDQTKCKMKQGYKGAKRSLYVQYKIKWVDWDDGVLPIKIFFFDVTDTGKRFDGPAGYGPEYGCQYEYEVKPCSNTSQGVEECIDVKRAILTIPTGGYIIYGFVHQHAGAVGSTLYGEDRRVLCTSIPIYGEGKEPGNEAGYIVGTSTCYPKPGSVKIADGEKLILESNYNSTLMHTGVMGLFFIYVADQMPMPILPASVHAHENMTKYAAGGIVILLGVALSAIAVVIRSGRLKRWREGSYQKIGISRTNPQ